MDKLDSSNRGYEILEYEFPLFIKLFFLHHDTLQDITTDKFKCQHLSVIV